MTSRPKAYIFDVDGTLADVTEYLHHIKGKPKDFDAFHRDSLAAPINREVHGILKGASLTNHIIIVTARMEKWRGCTSLWLAQSGVTHDALFMRPNKDYRADYEIKKEMPYVPTPIIYQDRVFFWNDGGIVVCANAENGKEIWNKRVAGKYTGSPVRAGKKIFCIDEEGTVVVIAASDTFQELGRNKLGEKSHSTPAISGGMMYVRTISHLFSIGGKKS